jgi:DNA-directed RNA polymerase subunit omega
MAIKRVHQFREGYEPLVESKNKEIVTALREIAAGKVRPEDKRFYTPLPGEDA